MDKSTEKKIDQVLRQIEEGYRRKKPIDKIKEIREKTNIKHSEYLTLKDLILASLEKEKVEKNEQKEASEEEGKRALKNLVTYLKRRDT